MLMSLIIPLSGWIISWVTHFIGKEIGEIEVDKDVDFMKDLTLIITVIKWQKRSLIGSFLKVLEKKKCVHEDSVFMVGSGSVAHPCC